MAETTTVYSVSTDPRLKGNYVISRVAPEVADIDPTQLGHTLICLIKGYLEFRQELKNAHPEQDEAEIMKVLESKLGH